MSARPSSLPGSARRLRRQLRQQFLEAGVDASRPGFYDQPAFRHRVRQDPTLWQAYARYVFALEPSAAYLQRARLAIYRTAAFIHTELVADGRPGRCLEAATLLSRLLERQGIWNVVVAGAYQAGLPSGHRLNFGPLSTNERVGFTAHTWVYAPPFAVVDVSLQQQPLPGWALRQLPPVLLQEEGEPGVLQGPEFFSAAGQRLFEQRHGRPPTVEDVVTLAPEIGVALDLFPPLTFQHEQVEFLYIPLTPRVLDGAFDETTTFRLNGKAPVTLQRQFLAQSGHSLAHS
ncbi:hypothetical protein [Deinococcus humi]|uniref:Uncharacterized protein n=1 Tax=Deinococcus humi TaxID=662880 RepID=A0A7W8NIU8_9DEIO|nr:hypothetical protein [Deinococcus humi]MBB5366208.1 hypothetical protein [Deinococcus humi]